MNEPKPIGPFFDDDRWQKKNAYMNQKRFRKARLKMTAALFSAFLILAIPYFRERYIDFNSLYNTRLSDFTLFDGLLPPGTEFFLFEIRIFLVFIALVFLYVLVMFSQMRRLKDRPNEEDYEDFKRLYNRFDVLVFIVHLMALYMVMNAFFFSAATISGRSMEPTLHDGDNVVMVHIDEQYDRYDLVVVRPESVDQEFFIKRLIGLPGETVRLDADGVSIDGTLIDEAYLSNGIETECPPSAGERPPSCSWDLGPNEYFLLGDNRENSMDSRHLGAFDKSQLYGQVQYRLLPLDSLGKVE
ncbi:MAG: signal peptidase I [Bacillota bacterium]